MHVCAFYSMIFLFGLYGLKAKNGAVKGDSKLVFFCGISKLRIVGRGTFCAAET